MASSDGSPLPARIGNYEVLDRLAVGGMAEIYLGRATGEAGFEKLVAIKRVRPHLARVPSFVEMFLDEARIAAKLSHSNIVQIFDLGKADDTYFIAMEYVPGLSLSELQRHFEHLQGRASGPLAALIMMNVCIALDHAHTKRDSDGRPLNIIHRDVSPSNIVVSFEGEIKLIDFGIVKAEQRLHQTQGGLIKGKRGYISPEQIRGEAADVRSDVFAAGMLLHGLLSQRRPQHDPADRWPLSPPSAYVDDVPPTLEAICVKAVEHDPAARYQSAAAMGAALEEYHHRNPFTRLQLSAWMKDTFRASYELQRRAVGMALPEVAITGPTYPPAMLPIHRDGTGRPAETAEVTASMPTAPRTDRSTPILVGPHNIDAPTAILDRPPPPITGGDAAAETSETEVRELVAPARRSSTGIRLVGAGALLLVVPIAILLYRWIGSPPPLDLQLDHGMPPPPTINLAVPLADRGIAQSTLDARAGLTSASDAAIVADAPAWKSKRATRVPALRKRKGKERKDRKDHKDSKTQAPEPNSSEKSKPDATKQAPRPKLPYESL